MEKIKREYISRAKEIDSLFARYSSAKAGYTEEQIRDLKLLYEVKKFKAYQADPKWEGLSFFGYLACISQVKIPKGLDLKATQKEIKSRFSVFYQEVKAREMRLTRAFQSLGLQERSRSRPKAQVPKHEKVFRQAVKLPPGEIEFLINRLKKYIAKAKAKAPALAKAS